MTNRLPEIIEYFDNLPWAQINQDQGQYTDECGCCVGAHLAYIFNVHRGTISDFYCGGRSLAANLDMSFEELSQALYLAGSPRYPFGTFHWKTSPEIVFRQLQENLGL